MKHLSLPKFSFPLICTAAVSLLPFKANAELLINEIMQSNIDCIMDPFNDFPDSWVEIYNPDSNSISFSGYSIGIDPDPSKAFALAPYFSIEAHAFQIVNCNKMGNPHQWSTDFRLESGKGCNVYLFKDGNVVDCITGLKKQPAPNIAYGRKTDGSDKWGYQFTPTPGQSNCGITVKDVLPDPIFSHKGAISPEPFSLSISIPSSAPETAVLKYTLDGSEPTLESATFDSPILINSTTIVRAKLFADSYLSPRSACQSYIFHPRTQTMPIVSIVTNPEYLYGEVIGIFSDYKWPLYGGDPNFVTDIRRPANFEFFFENETSADLNQLGEVRIKGEASRFYPLKSLAIYANKRFGTKRFDYEFFPDQKPGLSDFKSLELRNGGAGESYRLMMRDAVIQRLMGQNSNIDWQAWRPSVVYLNGEYYGMLNIRERANEDNIYTNYDGLEDIDMVENWSVLKTGSLDSFTEFQKFYSSENPSYENFVKRMDIESFINHTIAYIFFLNLDYPNNNFIMWRPQANDGKWRFSLKDLDYGLGLFDPYNHPTFHWIYNPELYPDRNWANTPESTLLLRTLLKFPEFKKEFIDRMTFYAGDFLTPAKITAMVESMANKIKGEVYESFKKNAPEWANFDRSLREAKEWIPLRWEFMKGNIAEFFELGKPVNLKLNSENNTNNTSFLFNNIHIQNPCFDGYYYHGENLRIEAENNDESYGVIGYNYHTKIDDTSTKTMFRHGSILDITIPDAQEITITPVYGTLGIDLVYNSDSDIDFSLPYEVYSLSGIKSGHDINSLPKGIYIIRQGSKSLKYKI